MGIRCFKLKKYYTSEHNLVTMITQHVIALTNFLVNNTTIRVNLLKMVAYLVMKAEVNQDTEGARKFFFWQATKAE
jgi:hypothetical protein